MNRFGKLFRISILGESHGNCIGILIDGCPAGLELSEEDFKEDLDRRKSTKKGTTERKEPDLPEIKSGIFKGKTTGAPILILFENKDRDSSKYEELKNTPRPGHADFVARKKYGGNNDYRGAGHFSGRVTVGLVAAGVIAKKVLKGVKIKAELIEAGGSKDIENEVEKAVEEGDSIGGIVECKVNGLPVGLGEPFFDSVESLISHIMFSIPAVKGIEFGSGFKCAEMKGSEHNDEIIDSHGKTRTNNAGGIIAGMTNGNELVLKVAVKPTPSISKIQKTFDVEKNEEREISIEGRHDLCIALRIPVIIESAVAIVLLDLMLMEQKIPRIMR